MLSIWVVQCVVTENNHTLPMEGFWFELSPPPSPSLWKFQFWFVLFLRHFRFSNKYFLKPHNVLSLLEVWTDSLSDHIPSDCPPALKPANVYITPELSASRDVRLGFSQENLEWLWDNRCLCSKATGMPVQGIKLHLMQMPMRLNFSLWPPNPEN